MQSWELDRSGATLVLTGDDKAFSASGDLKGEQENQPTDPGRTTPPDNSFE